MSWKERPQTAAWLKRVIDSSRDYAIILMTPDGTFVDWLGAAPYVFGYTAEEAIGLPFSSIFTPEDRERGMDRHELELATSSGRSEDNRWHVRKNGMTFWASGVLWPVQDHAGAVLGFCKAVQDRTDVRMQLDAQQNLVDSQREQIARRAKLLATAGHELRNAIAPLSNTVLLLEKSMDRLPRREWIDILGRQVKLLSRLLDDLAEAGRVDSASTKIAPQRLLLQEALRAAIAAMGEEVAQREQIVKMVLPQVPIYIDADPARLQQMLLNLLGNASKYTPAHGHIQLTVSVEVPVAVIRIEDDGVGIDKGMLPHIFDLFTRAPAADAQDVEGSGIGLAVVKHLASLHGGGVEARSAGPGKGSLFILQLPLPAERR